MPPHDLLVLRDLRPLSFGEILDGAFVLYRRGFSILLGTSVLASALAWVLDLLFSRPLHGTVVPTLIRMVVEAVAWAALTWHVSRLYTGHAVSVNEGLEAAGARLLPLLGAWLIAFVLYGVPLQLARGLVFGITVRAGLSGRSDAMVLSLLPWIGYLVILAVALALAFAIVPAVVLEGAGPWQAVARSFRLAREALVRIAALALLIIAIYLAISLGLTRMAGWSDDPAALGSLPGQMLLVGARTVLLPLAVGAAVLMYYDRRVRTEGLDLRTAADELMEEGMGDEGDLESAGDAEPAPADAGEEARHPSG